MYIYIYIYNIHPVSEVLPMPFRDYLTVELYLFLLPGICLLGICVGNFGKLDGFHPSVLSAS